MVLFVIIKSKVQELKHYIRQILDSCGKRGHKSAVVVHKSVAADMDCIRNLCMAQQFLLSTRLLNSF